MLALWSREEKDTLVLLITFPLVSDVLLRFGLC